MNSISIVIPVYNSESTLVELIGRLAQVLPSLAPVYEIIMVNDGSRDSSWEIIDQLTQAYPWASGINLMRNYGQHNALLCGVRQARYEIIVTMDDDLQHPPEEIHKLLKALSQGNDVVYGIPQKQPHDWWRNIFSMIIRRLLAYVMGVKNIRDFASFRAFRAHLRGAFADYRNPNVILDVLLAWGTTRFATALVTEMPRTVGRSNYNFFNLVQYTMIVLTGFSTVPLRFTSMVGFIFTFVGIAIFLYVLAIYFLVGSIPGFPFLASIISIFSGTQLFALGIIGEYLARIFDRSMDRPAYVVRESIRQGEGQYNRPKDKVEAA